MSQSTARPTRFLFGQNTDDGFFHLSFDGDNGPVNLKLPLDSAVSLAECCQRILNTRLKLLSVRSDLTTREQP